MNAIGHTTISMSLFRAFWMKLAVATWLLVSGIAVLVAEEPAAKAAKNPTSDGKEKDLPKQAARGNKGTKGKADPTRWEETIKKFEADDATTPPTKGAVLLVGGSNARRWTDVADYFPQHHLINRGFGGAQLADVLYFVDRIVISYAPKTILLNAGGNDLGAGKTPQQIGDAARAFAAKVHATLPDTRIYCLGLPPVRRTNESPEALAVIRRFNESLAEVARTEKNVEFIDLFPAFSDEQGKPRADYFVEDGTHFSPKGYAAVAAVLKGKL